MIGEGGKNTLMQKISLTIVKVLRGKIVSRFPLSPIIVSVVADLLNRHEKSRKLNLALKTYTSITLILSVLFANELCDFRNKLS